MAKEKDKKKNAKETKVQEVKKEVVPEVKEEEPKEEAVKVVDTTDGKKNGQTKCPKCGSTDIEINVNTGKLRCNFCRHEFDPEKISGMETDIKNLKGEVIGSGAKDIIADTKDVVTFKCSSCGAEVVVDTASATQARCHWCRNVLSVNEQIPNGSVPDVVLPFKVKKEEAKKEIENFVGKRKFFAHPKFTQEFTTENIMGVYFPYMVIDVNAHSTLTGQGEHLVRQYTRKEGDNVVTYYDADLYNVKRDFDVAINGLTVESSLDKLNKESKDKTTNINNAIMPIDIENAAKWNANYLRGYNSEKRDTNIKQLKPLVKKQAKDIAKFAANDTLKLYDRGVAWESEQLDVKGQQWKAAYLPVWLYSYQEVKGDKKLLHYVAVNARTKKTMGSVPIHMPKLITISALIEVAGIVAMIFVDWDYDWIFLLFGIIYFFVMYSRYRNKDARHEYEFDTKREIRNVKETDNLVGRRTGLSSSRMVGANNTSIGTESFEDSLINQIKEETPVGTVMNMVNKKDKK